MNTEINPWPPINVTINADGTGEINVSGTSHPITEPTPEAARAYAQHFVITNVARRLDRAVLLISHENGQAWTIGVYPNGDIYDPKTGTLHPAQEPVAANNDVEVIPLPASPPKTPGMPLPPPAPSPVQPQASINTPPQAQISSAPLTLRPSQLPSFLAQSVIERPATHGVRGILTRVGINAAPSEAERHERIDASAVSQHWPGTRTIAVVNGKGGANKTPTTALLAAVFARYGGAGVLAWDNNETRGTLGWRTEQGPHHAHVHDLLRNAADLQTMDAHLGAIDAFVHHQSLDRYAVLRSNPELLAHVSRLSAASFDAIHQIAMRYFRIVIIDSGNDESAENWLRMIDRADHIVVASTTRPEHAEAARLLLDALHGRDEHSARLAAGATMIISQADKEEASADHIAQQFSQTVRAAVTIPYDRAMRNAHLGYDGLAPATARAWLHAGAQVAAAL